MSVTNYFQMFKIGDRVILIGSPDKYTGVIIKDNKRDGSYCVEWDNSNYKVKTWVLYRDIKLHTQEIRDRKLTKLGI